MRAARTGSDSGYRILAVVAATGGTAAVPRVLSDLGAHFALPIALVQHMSPECPHEFREWLAGVVPFEVEMAGREARRPCAGTVYVPPADHHLCVDGSGVRADGAPPERFQRPCGDRLLRSIARHVGRPAIGVVLTGMGDDGADGLLALRRAGGFTIAEDAATSLARGMPEAAIARGAACEALPLERIGARIRALVGAPDRLEYPARG